MSKETEFDSDFDAVEETETNTKKAVTKKASTAKMPVYTYVGGGEDSPRKINFMGRQVFVRGIAAEVSDPVVLAKIENNPTFTKGTVKAEDLHDADEEAVEKASKKKKEDEKIDAAYKKRHG